MGIDYLIFGNVDSRDYDILVFFKDVDHTPKRVYQRIAIPGRNGEFFLDENRFEDVQVSYDCVALNDTDRKNFVNALSAQTGHARLTDTFNIGEYCSAVFDGDVDPNVRPNRDSSTFTIAFTRKPQRWLTSGEDAVTMGEWGDTETASGSIATFEGDEATGIKSLVADIEPIQDLNGYDKPWAGGAGKNKLPYPYYDDSQTKNGITFTVNSDGTIKANGTATAEATFYFLNNQSLASIGLTSGTYVLNGCPSGGSSSTYRIQIRQNGTWREETGSGLTFTYDASSPVNDLIRIDILSGATVDNIVFKPMIRLSSVSDATYEPYENICPISGYDSVETSAVGKNLLPTRTDGYTNTTNGVTATFNSDGSVTLNGTATATAIWNLISNTASDNRLYLPQGDYILNGDSVADNNFWIGAYKNADSGTWPISSKKSGGAFTVASGDYIFPRIRIGSGVVLNNVTIYPMIRLASETDSTYEPYNGNTYTTNLSSTRYGGTLDVVSGVLTVTHKLVSISDVSWTYDSAYTRFYHQFSDATEGVTRITKAASSCFESITDGRALSSVPNNAIYFGGGNRTIYIKTTDYTTSSAFVSAFGSQTILYPLDTPTTVQLTAQQVSALVGTNNVWANSGDVTVEYGTAPNVLVNPTLFESSPLLAVEGYGTIGFNGYEIELDNAVLGDTVIANSGTLSGRKLSSYSDNYTANIYLYPEAFNVGDTIIYGDVSLTAVVKMSPPQSATITSIESATSGLAVTAVPDGTGSFDVTLNYTVPGGTFTSGESSAVIASQSLQTKVNLSDSTSLTRDNTFIISSAWFGNLNPPRENFSFTLQDSTSAKPTALTINYKTIRADSTLSALGHPTYIDCDIGEAYLLNSGVPISLNQHIDLGSDLPKLASGANEIAYDNTITELKVTPRWWKV